MAMGYKTTSTSSAPDQASDYQPADHGVNSKFTELKEALQEGGDYRDLSEDQTELGEFSDADVDEPTSPEPTTPSVYEDGDMWDSALEERSEEPRIEPQEVRDSIETLQDGESITIGAGDTQAVGGFAGESANLALNEHGLSYEEAAARRADANALEDDVIGVGGDYDNMAEGPGSGRRPNGGAIAEHEYVTRDPDDARIGPTHIPTPEEMSEDLQGSIMRPEEIPDEAATAVEDHYMDIAGEDVPRREGQTLASQEATEAETNEKIQRRKELFDDLDEYGREALEEREQRRADGWRTEAIEEARERAEQQRADREEFQLSHEEASAFFSQLTEGQQETLDRKLIEVQDRYGISRKQARREFAQFFADNRGQTDFVSFEHYPGVDIMHPEVNSEATPDSIQKETQKALSHVKQVGHGGFGEIHNEDFDDLVSGPHNDYSGLDRGDIMGEVTGVVAPEKITRDGIKQVFYVRHPEADVSHDIKVTVWDSAENPSMEDRPPGYIHSSDTKDVPIPKKGEMVRLDSAKVRVHNPNSLLQDSLSGMPDSKEEAFYHRNRNVRVAEVDSSSVLEITEQTDDNIARDRLTTGKGYAGVSFPYDSGSGDSAVATSTATLGPHDPDKSSTSDKPLSQTTIQARTEQKQQTETKPKNPSRSGDTPVDVSAKVGSSEVLTRLHRDFDEGGERPDYRLRSEFDLYFTEDEIGELPDGPHLSVSTTDDGARKINIDPQGLLSDEQRSLIEKKIDTSYSASE